MVSLAVLVVIGAAVGVALVATSGGSPASSGAAGGARIDVADATAVDCPKVAPPGAGHPSPVLSQLFSVKSTAGTGYLLGWEIVPYKSSTTTYRLGSPGAILALEPAAGGRPVGYGTGSLTFAGGTTAGSIDATITLKSGGSLAVSGQWTCPAGSASTG